MNKVHDATKEYLKDDIPEFDTGDTLIVSVLVREATKNEFRILKVWLSEEEQEKV